MLSVEEIVNHIHNHLKPWLDADLILNAQYLIRVGVKKQIPVLKVIGICLQVSDTPHQIVIDLTRSDCGSK